MSEKARAAYVEWRKADAAAREAETELAAAWSTSLEGSGSPPPQELLKEVSRLRAVANDKLTAVMLTLSVRP